MANGTHELDSYVVWLSRDGQPHLHGPYPSDIAARLVGYAPGPATVVAASTAADDTYRMVEALLNYDAVASDISWRVTALLVSNIRHTACTTQEPVKAAMYHVLGQLETSATLDDIVGALISAGFVAG